MDIFLGQLLQNNARTPNWRFPPGPNEVARALQKQPIGAQLESPKLIEGNLNNNAYYGLVPDHAWHAPKMLLKGKQTASLVVLAILQLYRK